MSAGRRIYLSAPHMGELELQFVREAFETNWISPAGPHIDNFEREFRELTGARHAVALSSGTAAVHLALILSGISRGDEVLCSTFTFIGSASPIIYQGATPVFIESDSATWNMSPDYLAEALTDRIQHGKKPKAVVLVHLYGISADIDPIRRLCDESGISFIEDAAESLGAYYKGRQTGTFGAFGIFSFNGNKIITTSGGGMLIAQDEGMARQARFLATQARDPAPHYEHSVVGYNYRLSNVLAGIGRGQIRVLGERVGRRRAIRETYRRLLSDLPGVGFMPEPSHGVSNAWLTCITVDPAIFGAAREDIRLALEAEDIESRPLWKPMHMQRAFAGCPYYGDGLSERLFEVGLCLPSGSSMDDSDVERVAAIVRSVQGRARGGT